MEVLAVSSTTNTVCDGIPGVTIVLSQTMIDVSGFVLSRHQFPCYCFRVKMRVPNFRERELFERFRFKQRPLLASHLISQNAYFKNVATA